MFAYVYVLANRRTKRLYIGFTKNLRQRLASHQKRDPDWQLAYYEAYASEAEAGQRERDLKQYGSALGHLKRRIKISLDLKWAGEASN
jgi:predicted GIY-YIG superfamily endonuclease